MEGRSPYDESRVGEDRPNLPVIEAVTAMHSRGYAVVFVSARIDVCRDTTEAWLRGHVGIDFAAVHMRTPGDVRKDAVVNAEQFCCHVRDSWTVAAVFDDRRQVWTCGAHWV